MTSIRNRYELKVLYEAKGAHNPICLTPVLRVSTVANLEKKERKTMATVRGWKCMCGTFEGQVEGDAVLAC
jgi:hypothetical protein